MSLFLRFIAVLVIFTMTPVGIELLENGEHLLREGHGAHAEHAEHAEGQEKPRPAEDPEHGCTGVFHACSCHVAPSFLLPEGRCGVNQQATLVSQSIATLWDDDGPRSGFETGVFRPPAA